jgi:hypothetical protein
MAHPGSPGARGAHNNSRHTLRSLPGSCRSLLLRRTPRYRTRRGSPPGSSNDSRWVRRSRFHTRRTRRKMAHNWCQCRHPRTRVRPGRSLHNPRPTRADNKRGRPRRHTSGTPRGRIPVRSAARSTWMRGPRTHALRHRRKPSTSQRRGDSSQSLRPSRSLWPAKHRGALCCPLPPPSG